LFSSTLEYGFNLGFPSDVTQIIVKGYLHTGGLVGASSAATIRYSGVMRGKIEAIGSPSHRSASGISGQCGSGTSFEQVFVREAVSLEVFSNLAGFCGYTPLDAGSSLKITNSYSRAYLVYTNLPGEFHAALVGNVDAQPTSLVNLTNIYTVPNLNPNNNRLIFRVFKAQISLNNVFYLNVNQHDSSNFTYQAPLNVFFFFSSILKKQILFKNNFFHFKRVTKILSILSLVLHKGFHQQIF
jgi:hypothetical protein